MLAHVRIQVIVDVMMVSWCLACTVGIEDTRVEGVDGDLDDLL